MKGFKHLLLFFACCLLFSGCTASSASSSQSLTVTRSAQGTAVVTAYPYLFEEYSHVSLLVDDWAFVYADGQAGYRHSGGEYCPLYSIAETALLPTAFASLWDEMTWLAQMYPYSAQQNAAPYWNGEGWTFSDLTGALLAQQVYPDIAALWADHTEEVQPASFNHTAPEQATNFWPNPTGDGVYVLVGEKVRLYDSWGNEQPTTALVRLVLEPKGNQQRLTVIDQDGTAILTLTSSSQDPLFCESDLCMDGDWFYWQTDNGSVLPYQITVE